MLGLVVEETAGPFDADERIAWLERFGHDLDAWVEQPCQL
jgi:hypothetical protein